MLGLPTQLGVIPACLLAGWLRSGRSLERWANLRPACKHCGSATSFAYVFAAFMVIDIGMLPLTPMLTLHHVCCLLGHAFAIFAIPMRFAYYLAGVCAFEVGSASANLLEAIVPARGLARQRRAWVHVTIMTLSNALALAASVSWTRDSRRSLAAKMFAVGATSCFCVMREREALLVALEAGPIGEVS